MPLNDAAISTLGSAVEQFPGAAQSITNSASDIFNYYQSERNYKRNRSDALSDWNLVNQYNSPEAQMQRFRDAGLNPNLIYGRGDSGSAGSVNTPEASAFQATGRSSRTNLDFMATQLGMADLKIKQAQANNLNVQTDVIREDFNLRRFQAQRAGFDVQRAGFDAERAGFDLGIEREFAADHRREAVRATRVQTDLSLNRDAREAALNSSNLQEALERMLSMQEQRKNTILDRDKTYSTIKRDSAETSRALQHIALMAKDGTLRDIEIALRKDGVNPNDPAWQRELMKLFKSLDFSGGDPYPIQDYRPGSKF